MTRLESFLIGTGLFLACTVDSFLTFIGVEKGIMKEINPITLYLIKAGWEVFFLVKLISPLVALWVLILLGKEIRWMKLLVLFVLVFYLAVNSWSAFLLSLGF